MRTILMTTALLAPAVASAEARPSPRERTEALLSTLMRVQDSPEEGELTAAAKVKNREVFQQLDDYFDFDQMIETTMSPHLGRFNPEQNQRFHHVFPQLIRMVAYPRAGSFLASCQRVIQRTEVEGNRAEVDMHIFRKEEDMEMDVTFYWQYQKNTWRLVDIAFDGAPLTKEYQNQIGRVIENEGVDTLLRKLDKRRREKSNVLP